MSTVDFIKELFCRVDNTVTQQNTTQKQTQAKPYSSEVVPLAPLLPALHNRIKG